MKETIISAFRLVTMTVVLSILIIGCHDSGIASKSIVKSAKEYGKESISSYLVDKAGRKGVTAPAIKSMEPIFVVDSFCVLNITLDVPDKENEAEYFYFINPDSSISEALHSKGALFHLIGECLNRSDAQEVMWGMHKESIYEKYKKEFSSPDSWQEIYIKKSQGLYTYNLTLKDLLLHGFQRLKDRGKFFDEHH